MTHFEVTDRRDVVAKRPDRYRSFPGWTRTASGDVLMGYRDARSAAGTRSHGSAGDFLLMRESGGQWGEAELLYRHEVDAEEMGCGDLTLLSGGTIGLWSRQWTPAASRSRDSYFAWSDDGGWTFSPRQPVRFDFFRSGWAPYGKVIELSGDLWLQGGYGRRPGETLSSAAGLVSRDRGRSWQLHSWIAEGSDGRGLNYYEPFMLRLADGTLFCLLRTDGTFYATRSTDGGRRWSPPAPAFRGMACAGLVLSSGEVLVTFRGIHEEHPQEVRENVKERRGRLYCGRTSDDGGATWGAEMEIDGNTAWQIGSYGMGDVLDSADGSVRVIYYTSDAEQAPWLAECRLVRR